MRYLNMAICLLSGAAVLSASAASGDGARFPEPCRLPAGVAFGHDASRKAFSLLADDIEVRVDGRLREARSIRVEDILYRNMRVELQDDTEPMVLQCGDDEKYDAKGRKGRPVLIAVRNDPWSDAGGGSARNVTFDGVDVTADPGVPEPVIRISAKPGRDGKSVRHENVVIRNIRLNGKPFNWKGSL